MATSQATLTTDQKLHLKQAAERLRRSFQGQLNVETIERFLYHSKDTLLAGARTTEWIPLLAERFARDRLRAIIRLQNPAAVTTPSILFLCVHNAGRSQMAAGLARALGGDRIEIFSGGSEPVESVNAVAVAAMAERGIDIADERPQPWSDEILHAADVVVTMGCGDACPVIPGKRYLDWELEDPTGKSLETVRAIRDEIEIRVRALLRELWPEA